MGTKMKGLIKGLRQISNIFDSKEQEMKIGYPTDVKHVAHIGWDGPAENAPTWMNDFQTPALASQDGVDLPQYHSSGKLKCPSSFQFNGQVKPITSPAESVLTGEPSGRKSREKSEKSTRRKKSSEKSSEVDSSTSKLSRRRQSSTGESGDGSRRSRRESKERSSEDGEAVQEEQDLPGVPKQSRRRKAKGLSTTNGGAVQNRSSRSKALGNVDQGIQEGSGEFIPPPSRPVKISDELRASM